MKGTRTNSLQEEISLAYLLRVMVVLCRIHNQKIFSKNCMNPRVTTNWKYGKFFRSEFCVSKNIICVNEAQ